MLPFGVDVEVLRPVEDGFRPFALAADGQFLLERIADDPFLRERGIEDGPVPSTVSILTG